MRDELQRLRTRLDDDDDIGKIVRDVEERTGSTFDNVPTIGWGACQLVQPTLKETSTP